MFAGLSRSRLHVSSLVPSKIQAVVLSGASSAVATNLDRRRIPNKQEMHGPRAIVPQEPRDKIYKYFPSTATARSARNV